MGRYEFAMAGAVFVLLVQWAMPEPEVETVTTYDGEWHSDLTVRCAVEGESAVEFEIRINPPGTLVDWELLAAALCPPADEPVVQGLSL